MIIFLYIALSFIFLVLGKLISKKTFLDREFQRPFECGFSTFNDHRIKFRLHFFLIALVFIIFDVELILLFPFFKQSFGLYTFKWCNFIYKIYFYSYPWIDKRMKPDN